MEYSYIFNKNLSTVESKYKKGDVVFAKAAPAVKLVVRRYIDKIYYCRVQGAAVHKELVYYEWEISSDSKGSDKGADKGVDKSADKGSDKGSDKGADKASESKSATEE